MFSDWRPVRLDPTVTSNGNVLGLRRLAGRPEEALPRSRVGGIDGPHRAGAPLLRGQKRVDGLSPGRDRLVELDW